MKKFITLTITLMMLISLIPTQAVQALTQGNISIGGDGVSWIEGAKAVPGFTMTILDETYDTPLEKIDTSGNYGAQLDAFNNSIRSEFKAKLPNNGDITKSIGRIYIMQTWLASDKSFPSTVNDIATYNASDKTLYSLGADRSYNLLYKLSSGYDAPDTEIPDFINTVLEQTFQYIKDQGGMDKIDDDWGAGGKAVKVDYDLAFKALRWIFKDETNVMGRLNQITYDAYYNNLDASARFTDDAIMYQQSSMLFLGAMMYYLCVENQDKAYIERRMSEYINGQDTSERPFLLEIEPASCWIKRDNQRFIMNTTDFMDFYALGPESCSFRAKGWQPNNDFTFVSLMETVFNYIHQHYPPGENEQPRMYTLPQGSHTNWATYGFSLATGMYYEWNGSTLGAALGEASGGYIRGINFFKEMYGFALAYNPAIVTPTVKPTGSQDISMDVSKSVTIDQDQPTIGENPVITLKSMSESKDIKSWENKFAKSQSSTFIIAASITKTSGPKTEVQALGSLENDDSSESCVISYDELMQFLEGTKTFQFQDMLESTVIANEEVITNVYNSEVWIAENVAGDKTWYRLTPNDGQAEKVYKRDPITPQYVSSPVTYSEIKDNEPENEDWEAMAGVPTTETLYFATGGSEFIIDLELKYVADQTTTRNYTDVFTKVECEDEVHVPNDKGGHTGACHHHNIGPFTYTWSQTLNYDYMKITKLQVWKIEESTVDGMRKITKADDEVTATIQQGDPTAFYNVADSDDAQGGRVLYSLYPEQLDSVKWTQASSNSHSNYTAENLAVVESHKALLNQATVVSDFIILQTNAGDQTAFYFDKKTDSIRNDTNFTFEKSSEDIMWLNNSNSASTWDTDHIAISSYNGKYKKVDSKYKTIGKGSNISTAYDSKSYGDVMSRPSRPGSQMLMYEQFEQYLTNKNGLYKTGDAETFYRHIIDIGKQSAMYTDDATAVEKYGSKGLIYESPYSPSHSKVNDIVLHDPVSSEKAMVIPLDDDRDQRTSDTKPALTAPKQDTTEYIKVLPDDYMNNIIFNGYARYENSKGLPLGWETTTSDAKATTFDDTENSPITDDSSAWSKDNDKNWDGKQRSFYIKNTSNITSYFTQSFSVESGKTYHLKASLTGGGNKHIGVEFLNSSGKQLSYTTTSTGDLKVTAPSGTSTIKIYLVNQGVAEVRFDNVQLYNESEKGIYTLNDLRVLDWKTTKNPLYHSHQEAGETPVKKYTCGNLPLNAGGTLAYKVTNAYHPNYYGYVLEDFESTEKETSLTWVEGPSSKCSNHKYWEVADHTPVLIGDPTYHVHTADCEYTLVYDCGLEDTSIGHNNETLFEYIGKTQQFTAPTIDTYTFEVWGAQGGTGTSKSLGGQGGLGGYSTGQIKLTAGQTIYINVGGQNGWNGGGTATLGANGGGASDIRMNGTDISDRVIVAGGGGGGGNGATGGYGGGTSGGTGSSTSEVDGGAGARATGGYGSNGVGTGAKTTSMAGAGGGGYYGGYAAESHSCSKADAGGGGGSGYVSSELSNTKTLGGNEQFNDYQGNKVTGNIGNGHIKITGSYVAGQPKYVEGWSSASIQPYQNPQSWEYIEKIKESKPLAEIVTPSGTFTPGNFVNLDYPFQVYFPNIGDFEGTNSLGISKTTKQRGYGFEDNMDTTTWTKEKYVTFQFDVTYKNNLYRAGERVYLPVDEDTFDFYCPLENKEARQAHVDFVAIAINNKYGELDGDETTNKARSSTKLMADHSSIKTYYIDVVGRIGNMTIQDTGDFRFANFFKKSFNNGEWLIENLVPTVDVTSQNYIVGEQEDIRGLSFKEQSNYLNTYGTESTKEQKPYTFPLSPKDNNIEALRRQPLRIGYPVFMDTELLGNYIQGSVQILPYYYSLDLRDGSIDPVDIYMSVNGSYKMINKFDKLVDGTVDTSNVYDNKVFLNWNDESDRRNYNSTQYNLSENTAKYFNENYTSIYAAGYSGDGSEEVLNPYGQYYVMGNNNALMLTPRARSFIGTDITNGTNHNPGNKIDSYEYSRQGTRWHFTLSLPSTAIPVKSGEKPTTDNFAKVSDRYHVILGALDIKAIGDTYALKNDVDNLEGVEIQTINDTGEVKTTKYDITKIPYQVVTVTSSDKTSRDDLAESGTH